MIIASTSATSKRERPRSRTMRTTSPRLQGDPRGEGAGEVPFVADHLVAFVPVDALGDEVDALAGALQQGHVIAIGMQSLGRLAAQSSIDALPPIWAMGSSLILLAASWLAWRTPGRGAKGGVVEVGPAPQDGELVPPLLHASRR